MDYVTSINVHSATVLTCSEPKYPIILISFYTPFITRWTRMEGQKINFVSPISVGKYKKYLKAVIQSYRK